MLDNGSKLDRLTGLGLLLTLELVTESKKKIKKMCIQQGHTDCTVKIWILWTRNNWFFFKTFVRIGRRNFCFIFYKMKLRFQIGVIRPIRLDHTDFFQVAIKPHSFSVVLDKEFFEHIPCALCVHLGFYPGSPCCPMTLLAHLHFLFYFDRHITYVWIYRNRQKKKPSKRLLHLHLV